MALKDIKTKIQATNRTHKVTRAMEAVSAVKMRKTQEQALAGRFYARAALSILARLSSTDELARNPLGQVREVKRRALVVITSDKGLAGALNSSVIKTALETVRDYPIESVTVYALGRKGRESFARRGYTIAESFENLSDTVEVAQLESLVTQIAKEFRAETYDEVLVAYNNFKSTFEQVPVVRKLLPLNLGDLTAVVEGIVPVKGRWSELQSFTPTASYTFEPEEGALLQLLLPRLLSVSLYHFLLEAKASEHSARMVAMKSASDKSKEVAHNLTRVFNKLRQATITREVSEIIGGREALAA